MQYGLRCSTTSRLIHSVAFSPSELGRHIWNGRYRDSERMGRATGSDHDDVHSH
jgi:hypothetical protein